MRVIVCGSAPRRKPWRRGWTDRELLRKELDELLWRLLQRHEPLVVVEGGAEGADRMAREWAEDHGIQVESYPARWDEYGRAAGRIRNRRMLGLGADGVLAFSSDWPITAGTADMCRIASAAKIPVVVVTEDGRSRWFDSLENGRLLDG